jgi:hypothetical protein
VNMHRVWLTLSIAGAIGLAACQDSILRAIQPENNEELTLQPDSFRYFLEDLKNVSDRRRWTWRNDNPKALFYHRSFLHHGYGLVIIRDAVGTVVDSTQLEWELNTDTKAGVPGDWTIDFILSTGRGRVDWSLKGVPEDAEVPEID